MKIYIPTRGRADKQHTARNLPPDADVVLVIPHADRRAYANVPWSVLVTPPNIRRIAPTRQWILNYHAQHGDTSFFAMFDDDLEFAVRRKDDPGKFLPARSVQTRQMLNKLEKQLQRVAHASVMARELNYAPCAEPLLFTTRMMRVLAYNAEVLLKEGVHFDRTQTMDDFDVTLQLLRKGYDNRVLASHVQNQRGGSGAQGGAAVYRSMEIHNGSAKVLKRLHGPYVRVVEKTTKTAWGGATRLDVVVSWKKAYADAQH